MQCQCGEQEEKNIKKLVDLHGVEHGGDDMGAATKAYFQNIFSADYTLEPTPVIHLIQSHVAVYLGNNICTQLSLVNTLFMAAQLIYSSTPHK